ncbi:MAG: hypothetical protein LBO02_02020 [Holosporaceae bacterium]|nr:hypothetical protein [Holosporaceae bacterium]
MSFLSNAAKLISRRKKSPEEEAAKISLSDPSLDLDFSLRNYAKESFSVLIVRPLSGYVLKLMRITSLLITGISAGLIAAALCFAIVMQFGSLENTILSSFIQSKFEKLLPESDLSMKSALLSWNSNVKAMEIVINKIRIDDLSMPRVSILPDYAESFKRQKLVMKTVSIMNPKICLGASDDFKSVSLNPNFEKGGTNKALLEPLSTFGNFKNLLEDGVILKLVNADVSVTENGVDWKLKNVYCEHKMGEKFPRIIDGTLYHLPEQGYMSNISLSKSEVGNKSVYDVKLESLNPLSISSAFAKRNIPIDSRIFLAIDGYNLPVSGTLKLNFEGTKFLGGKFDLVGAEGSIRLPIKNTLSLNLGKRIDSGSVSGSFSENHAQIDSINISYGDSGLQLTGISVPLSEFKFLDVANIDGTLSLTNIGVNEMETILPENISRSAIATFKNCLPGFKLEVFKVDLDGAVAFGNRASGEKLNVGQGIFKIKGAKIPIGEHFVTNVDAIGTISDDGLDIRLTNAFFNKTRINNGMFFVSNQDNSWIGRVNASVPLGDISSYVRDISPRLASLPLDKIQIRGLANLDMKLVRVEGDRKLRDLPFRIVEGEGVIKSNDNARELRLSWNNERLSLQGDVNAGSNKIKLNIDENLVQNSGKGEFQFVANSEFLNSFIPKIGKMCGGNYHLKINSSWKDRQNEYDVNMNLKDAAVFIPIIGDVKTKNDDGYFKAHIENNNGNYEISNMSFVSKDNKISGKMTLDKNCNLLKCSFDEFEVNGSSVKINIMKEKNNILFSAVGKRLDARKIFSVSDYVDKDTAISAYINLKEMDFSDMHKIRNAKGSLEILNGKIIGGACYAVIGVDTTLALTAKDIDGANDVLLSLSASNAGEFLKYLKITDTVSGGTINFVTKSTKNASKSFSGAVEINDFIVKNNSQLTKLISLSSTNWLPNSDNLSVGFNFCFGNFTIAENKIVIENGKAISPTIGISYNGSYDRVNDIFDIYGIALPTSSILNNQNANGTPVANYQISGSLGMPIISVKPLKFISNSALDEIFGNMLPIMPSIGEESVVASNGGRINDNIAPPEKATDPFSQGAFDKKADDRIVEDKKEEDTILPRRPNLRKRSVDNKFGIRIVRGVKSGD